ncbi:MAG: GNAT family N-acetyltransferase [Leeuwenhoekiella sp.]
MKNTIVFTAKKFDNFTLDELYAVLRLRSEVFVVEQDCVYQDIDNKDQHALHILGFWEKELVAYTRIFEPGAYFERASIGRVIVQERARGKNFGKQLMEFSILAIAKAYATHEITISAQVYLNRFYSELGFVNEGSEYLEDGIPHIKMNYNP